MKSKNILIILLILTTLGIGTFMLFNKKEDTTQEKQDTNATFTMSQVSEHASRTDCWTVINGSVYDITSYVPRHPGGDEILQACGTDGTTLFTQRKTATGESVGSGTPHGSSAKSQLSSLKIGELAQ